MAVTRGAETESRSQSRRGDAMARATEAVPTMIDPRTPPTIEITRKSHTEMDRSPKAAEAIRAITPRKREVARVRTVDANMFCGRKSSRRRETEKRPEWIPVPRRDARAPKM